MKTALLTAITLMISAPAWAVPSGFGFAPTGAVTADTSDLTANTLSTTYPGADVNIAGFGDLSFIHAGDPVTPTPLTFSYAPGLSVGRTHLAVDADGMVFEFTSVHTLARGEGLITALWDGVVTTSVTANIPVGSAANLSQSCDQTPGGIINCSNTESTRVEINPIREPGSLALLGSMLLGAGFIIRRRRNRQGYSL